MDIKKIDKNNSLKKNSGQEMVEWWFIVSVVAFIVMFSLITWGKETTIMVNNVINGLKGVNTNITTST